MNIPSEHQALAAVQDHLAELLHIDRTKIRVSSDPAATDAGIQAGPFTFVVEWKSNGSLPHIDAATQRLKQYADSTKPGLIPLLAVPFMSDAGAQRCLEANAQWLDLSGNAHIFAPGVHILVQGKPNRFKSRGRPPNVFAPKSSRITRWLLMHPGQSFSQRELAQATDSDEGYTSKVVGRLEDQNLIVRDDSGAIQARDEALLLDAWREVHDFSVHQIIKGHVPARNGDALVGRLAKTLEETETPFAFTGLAAAWMIDPFAGFRLASVYLKEVPSPQLIARLGFREEAQGANTWLVIPRDIGVFHGAQKNGGFRHVHPIQVHLDLKGHPERAEEAAAHLRAEVLFRRSDG